MTHRSAAWTRTARGILFPLAAGLLGASVLLAFYLGIVSLAESPTRALELLWEDRTFVVPIGLGFGVQVGLYTVLRLSLYLPMQVAQGGRTTATNGGVSTLAMAACCAHRVADLFPVVGLSAAATALAGWKEPLQWIAVFSNLIGVGIMVFTLVRQRRRARPEGAA